jgi:molybdopterin/thiamine biosynthesis adenylyltransferase
MVELSVIAPITVVFDEDVERCLDAVSNGLGTAAGNGFIARYAPEESLITVHMSNGNRQDNIFHKNTAIACACIRLVLDGIPNYPTEAGTMPALVLGNWGDSDLLAAFFFPSFDSDAIRCDLDVIRIESDLFSRVKGIFDSAILTPKTVGVVGLGSGGSVCALEIAKCGVGNFILVDFDRLKSHNVSRHVCGLADVGRFKTRAVRDAILQHNPQAVIRCYEVDICDDADLMDQIIDECDLMIVATDSGLSKYLINEACLAMEKPAIYGGAYERAFAGEVIRVIPGQGGCYSCVREDMAETVRSISTNQEFDYTDDTVFEAEPGLGLDVSFIALVQAKFALMTLLRDTGSTLGDIDAEMIIWTNWARPDDGQLFERPMMSHYLRVAQSDDCPSCGGDMQSEGESL